MVRKKVEQEKGAVAYSYIRFSRPEQAGGDSLRRQTELTRDWCRRSGVLLDESLTFRDLGVSGYTGEHRTNPDRHALAAFVAMVKEGRVRPGSYLIIENLDRLSREHTRAAVKLFLDLLDNRINIVTTSPERLFRHESQDMTDIIIAVVELSRGHSESAAKSERCRASWAEKKRQAAKDRKPITRVVPAWIEVQDGGFRVDPEKAEVVRRIYRMARDGYGIDAIVKTLNHDGVKPISVGKRRGKYWATSYVAAILLSRATVGEYQPHKGKWKRGNPKARQPDGDPIPNYFPKVISDDEWHATRSAVEGRRRAVGRPGRMVNLFKNLIHDARTRTAMHARKCGDGPSVIYPYAFTLGQAPFVSFPMFAFENGILSCLREVDPRSILPDDRSADEVLVLSGKLADLEGRIEKIKLKLMAEADDLEPVIDVLRRLEAERKDTADRLAEARQKAASPLGEAWGETHSLVTTLEAAPDQDAARTRLRAVLRRVVDQIWVLIVRRGDWTVAAVQVRFKGGDKHRDFLIAYWPPRTGCLKVSRPATWSVVSLALPGDDGELDLRRPGDAVACERFLSRLDPKAMG